MKVHACRIGTRSGKLLFMYALVFALLLLAGAALISNGVRCRSNPAIGAGTCLVAATVAFFALMTFWGEMLWFDELGYSSRFWTVVWARVGLGAAGALGGAALIGLLTWPLPRESRITRWWPEVVGAVLGGMWGVGHWETILLFWNAASTGQTDPILGYDLGFYLFELPFFDSVYEFLVFQVLIACGATALVAIEPVTRQIHGDLPVTWNVLLHSDGQPREGRAGPTHKQVRALMLSVGVFLLVLASGNILSRFHLLFSQEGVVSGASWTDVMIRMPAYGLVAAITAATGVGIAVLGMAPALARQAGLYGTGKTGYQRLTTAGAGVAGVLALVWLLALGIAPALVQWLRVEPNEITLERPYLTHNIEFTRRAFGLDDVEDHEFPAADKLTAETIENNRDVLSQVRLWDPRALMAVYSQFQEIRLYYEFNDVDIDRYHINGSYRQVMVSPRELEPDNLPRTSQTFVNRRFKYTHGYGLTMAPVSEFTENELPRLLIRDLPPKAEYESLAVTRPQMYYGELTDEPVVVNTTEGEFDYPSGNDNVYIHYDGTGGVQLNSFWRKLIYGWKFDGVQFLLSSYPQADSRVMFDRSIRRRVGKLAPFLVIDYDPYVVLNDGRLFWIVDCYTTATSYPYSEAFRNRDAVWHLDGVNYLRNAVKAVVDAYHGSVTLYVFEPDDPVIQTWQAIFPDLFHDADEMPADLRRHVRYPEDLLLAQGLVYAKYHMTDPAVFYNQEDLWVRATERYYANVQPVDPYYIMWRPHKSDDLEFVLIQPFTPKNKQVLIGWIAGMSDGDNYGRLLAYQFPKEKRVLGTQQVETKIDQDAYLSERLTLWDQRGSRVIRGNLLVIPVDETLLYVEPIYLQAEAAAYPELRLVIAMHNDRLSYAETFDEALRGLLPGAAPPTRRDGYPRRDDVVAAPEGPIREASESFRRYLQLMGEEEFEEAARELRKLSDSLQDLAGEPPPRAAKSTTSPAPPEPK